VSESDRLLTAREVAERLGVSTETVLRWVRRGELSAIRLPGGALRFRETAFEAWLAARATGAADRGVSATRTDRAHRSVLSLPSMTSATPPPEAATIEED
jgi:excisionase family DNA binding protein